MKVQSMRYEGIALGSLVHLIFIAKSRRPPVEERVEDERYVRD